MESLGQLFRKDVKLYVYPSLDRSGKMTTVEDVGGCAASQVSSLLAHLVDNRYVEDIRGYNPDWLAIYFGDVLNKIKTGDASWEKWFPRRCAGHRSQKACLVMGKSRIEPLERCRLLRRRKGARLLWSVPP